MQCVCSRQGKFIPIKNEESDGWFSQKKHVSNFLLTADSL